MSSASSWNWFCRKAWRATGPWIGLLLAAGPFAAAGAESVRDQEIRECRVGEVSTWGDGQDRPAISSPLLFDYLPTNAPAWFPAPLVANMIGKAAAAWSECGVRGELLASGIAPTSPRDLVRVQWSEPGAAGNFGLANLGQRTLSLGPKAFELLRAKNPRHDARDTLQMVISHEMGHFFGLMAHSRRCVDVLSYYHNERGGQCYSRDPAQLRAVAEYRHVLPTACDIARCRAANGMPAVADSPPRAR